MAGLASAVLVESLSTQDGDLGALQLLPSNVLTFSFILLVADEHKVFLTMKFSNLTA